MRTEEVKTFIEILYLIIGYGPLRVMREFPAKRRKTFGLDKLTTKLLKMWTSKRTHGVAYVSCVAFKLNNANKKYTNKSIIVVVTLA